MSADAISSFFCALDQCQIIETHVSTVYLTQTRAYKRKKPVNFPYLDYSTLEKRAYYCRREVELNRRTAPHIYRGVKAICCKNDGSIYLADDPNDEMLAQDKIIDWVVEMNRFDDSFLLDHLARNQLLPRSLLETLAETIAAFHGDAAIRCDKGGYEGLSFIVSNNAECFKRFAHGIFLPDRVIELNHRTRAEVDRLEHILNQRRQQGLVRQCHGDLHLRNIFLDGDRPVMFDAIEFNDDIGCIDILYDLAFLLMDLDERRLKQEASVVFNRYMDITGDVTGLAALPLMLSLRAAIRAHVGAAALTEKQGSTTHHEALEETRLYFENALRHLNRHPPRLIAVGGLSGSGKSHLARSLAPMVHPTPGALVLRSDAIRKRLCGVAMLERLPADAYSTAMSSQTYDRLCTDAQEALISGHTVIADAVFSKPEERQAIESIATTLDIPFIGLWVSATPEIMAERICTRRNNISDATEAVLKQQLAYNLGEITWTPVDSSGPASTTKAFALAILNDQNH